MERELEERKRGRPTQDDGEDVPSISSRDGDMRQAQTEDVDDADVDETGSELELTDEED